LVCSFLSFALGAIADIAELPRPFDKAPLGACAVALYRDAERR
jgi:hypothetical protein